MKTAIVTGAAGFIGRVLTKRLLEDGWGVYAIDDLSTVDVWNVEHPNLTKVRRSAQMHVPRLVGADAIFHLAGKVGPVGVLKYSGQIAYDTITSANAVGIWSQLYKCPLIFTSTSEVYGSPDAANSETTPKVFQGPASARQEYAAAKMAAEVMLINRGIDVRVVRPFNVTGAGQDTRGGFVLPRFVQQALRGEPLTVYQPGTQQRAFTHVEDIVHGMILSYERGERGEIYNLGNADNKCSIKQLAFEVCMQAGSSSAINVIDPRILHGPLFREAPDKLPNAGKATMQLGWVPVWDRAEIIEDVIRYERKMMNG